MRIINISLKTAELWIANGVIWLDCIGSENVYFTNEFGMTFYFKALDAVSECKG